LGSTSLVTDANGQSPIETRYTAWGEVRYTTPNTTLPTKYTYTGQYSYTSDFGLMFYNARWVDVSLGRFAQADSLVGGDRYTYVNNSPVRFTDPTGHRSCDDVDENGKCVTSSGNFSKTNNLSSLTSTGSGKCQRIGNSYCDGKRIYQVYLWYKVNQGWWNEDGNFTAADFLAMILMGEANGNEHDLIAIMVAVGNQLWGSSDQRTAYCTSQNCEAGIFNFIGAYMQSAGERYNGIYDSRSANHGNVSAGTYAGLSAPPTGGYGRLAKLGLSLDDVANRVVYSQTFRQIDGNDPTDWGVVGRDRDLKWFRKAWAHNAPSGTTNPCGVFHTGYDVVYTDNQAATWGAAYVNCP